MKIISLRKGFTADHSSTSYEFLAVDKPLAEQAIKEVSSLSSRACPDERNVSFIYHGDFSDLPGGWRPLMEKYYDIMYSESYDWWLFAIAFPVSKDQQKKLERYSFSGLEDLGVGIRFYQERAIVSLHCLLDYNEAHSVLSNDSLFSLLSKVRQQLIDGDHRIFDVFWYEYGDPLYADDELEEMEIPFNDVDYESLPDSLQLFSRMITSF